MVSWVGCSEHESSVGLPLNLPVAVTGEPGTIWYQQLEPEKIRPTQLLFFLGGARGDSPNIQTRFCCPPAISKGDYDYGEATG